MKRVPLIAVAVLALWCAEADATTIHGAPEESPFQAWADQALVPTPEGEAYMTFGSPRAESFGRVIRWWPVGVGLNENGRLTFLHELGHILDGTGQLGKNGRRAFGRIMNAPRRPWWRGTSSLGEKFAMAYAFCAGGVLPSPTAGYWGYGYQPTERQHSRACSLIRGG